MPAARQSAIKVGQLEPGIGGPHRGWDQPARGNTGADALGLFRAARDPEFKVLAQRALGDTFSAVAY
jgi:hypothetical protein